MPETSGLKSTVREVPEGLGKSDSLAATRTDCFQYTPKMFDEFRVSAAPKPVCSKFAWRGVSYFQKFGDFSPFLGGRLQSFAPS